jgi:hypothetical protein
MQNTKGHQERGVHCDLWVQRLASSKSFKNKSAVFSYLQWKYASFARLLNGKMKQQIVTVVAEKLCLHRCMILLKSSNSFCIPIVVNKVRSYNSVFVFMSMGASLAKNALIDEHLANAPEGV